MQSLGFFTTFRLATKLVISVALITLILWGCGGSGSSSLTTTTTTTVTTAPLTATALATGDTHTCASLPDKTVRCWGDNTYGQLGTDPKVPRAYNPLTVSGVTNATAVTGGDAHTCALLSDTTVSCWGSNISGQLGNGTTNDSSTPVAVTGLTRVTAITASHAREDSYGHTCALITGGTVKCWGRNIDGQLGTGNTSDSYTPIPVTGLSGVTAVQAGGWHNCALITGGTIKCWGNNAEGEMGNGTIATPQTTPIPVTTINNATAIAMGADFSCTLLTNGTVWCWGNNGQGRLGNGTTTDSLWPVMVIGITNAIAITAGRGHACAVLTGGTVKCWGDNSAAMLGNGTTTSSSIPVTVTGLSNAVSLSSGSVHTCAKLTDGTVQCWGDNASAEIGPGSMTNSTTPAPALRYTPNTAISSVTAATAGSQHTCGLISDGSVDCWGWNGSDQLGTTAFARSSTALVVSGVSGATAISAGGWHTCSLLSNNTVNCWGDNTYGQLGNGTTTNSGTPVVASGVTGATAIAAGSARTCAVTGGLVQCWGDNDQGQLGNNTSSSTPVTTPVYVSGILNASAVTGGYNHNCTLLTGGAIECWGANYSGQLGNGTLTQSTVPVGVSGLYTATSTPISCPTRSCGSGRSCAWGAPACVSGTTTTYTGNAIALGIGNMGDHTCAVISGGTVQCWGDNTYGQLGNGTTTNSSTPVSVTGISTATAVAVGGYHSCARLSDSTVKCWGWNILGQLGNGTTTDSLVPVTVSGVLDATTISAGFDHSCAVHSDHSVTCWGDNSYTQLGLGVLAVSSSTPSGITVVTRTTSKGHSYPTCNVAQLMSGAAICVLDGNLIIRTGMINLVIPLPPD